MLWNWHSTVLYLLVKGYLHNVINVIPNVCYADEWIKLQHQKIQKLKMEK